MAPQLNPKAESRITEMIATGDYPDADSVVDKALELLLERERFLELKAKIALGVEEVAQGRVVEFTPELREQLWQSAIDRAAKEHSTILDARI